ncbi:CLUMA_CG014484, isoform A [Clunio marinus]|uniref:CLUMA_CG014484, isoform A n=1 Tax=Clunio marinus TaxID=568069 RepID=A0A1J1IML5_9DIPT|nr:CLUMA_CG014484, isoform A [Clunio marinus]
MKSFSLIGILCFVSLTTQQHQPQGPPGGGGIPQDILEAVQKVDSDMQSMMSSNQFDKNVIVEDLKGIVEAAKHHMDGAPQQVQAALENIENKINELSSSTSTDMQSNGQKVGEIMMLFSQMDEGAQDGQSNHGDHGHTGNNEGATANNNRGNNNRGKNNQIQKGRKQAKNRRNNRNRKNKGGLNI